MSIQLGLTRVLQDPAVAAPLRGKRLGLVCHEASVDERCRHAVDLVQERQSALGATLAAVFSPQHGLWGQDQDNMVETPHGRWKGVPLFSLYSETRKPTPAMLEGVDTLVVDLQDIGTRIYTFAYTMSHVMEAAAEQGQEVVILDRPNPIGGGGGGGRRLRPGDRAVVG